jgi:transcriptional regulator GlxA family with amidase domain
MAVPETAGSALYGIFDVLSVTGTLWQTLSGDDAASNLIRPRILSTTTDPFYCGHGIPVHPALALSQANHADIIILPEIWLAPDENFHGRYPELTAWIRHMYRAGACIYSACSGSIMLAETGLLDGCEATSHWGYEDMFRRHYPGVQFKVGPTLVFADADGRIVTAGGTTSWHDLILHIIARHCSPGEALRIAKVYLLKWHGEGQLPYANLVRRHHHADSVVRDCENWLAEHFREKNCITRVLERSGLPQRTLKRRFKSATGISLIEYIQRLRVEHAKRLLESDEASIEAISTESGYEDVAFFRRLFKRSTGLTPGQYRRMFKGDHMEAAH